MKKINLFLLFVLLLPISNAYWFVNSKEVYVAFDISSGAEIVPLSQNYKVKNIGINLSFFPKATHGQDLIEIYTTPEAEKNPESIYFKWDEPSTKSVGFNVKAKLKKTNDVVKVKDKAKFPILELPEDIVEFIEPSITIDSDNEEIVRLASKIVEGEDDLYAAVYKIAEWTKNNINYNLSTLTADVSQKASWVLSNRQGVCDELTSLFIAMLRAVGVPARFISGIAYTNSPLFPEEWGPHGWAEVYFPSYGWVPYDVTYGQFGFVDPTHFKFKETLDPDTPSTQFSWAGKDVDLNTEELDIKTKLIRHAGEFDFGISMDVFVEKDSVKFGSYNIVQLIVENINGYYTTTEVYLSTPEEVESLGRRERSILLKPNEKVNLYWIVKVDDNLNENSMYTMPVVVSNSNNLSAQAFFNTSVKGIFFSYDGINNILEGKREEENKRHSANLEIDCNDVVPFYYYENRSVNCTIRNLGNVYLEKLSVCVEDSCKLDGLGISQQKEFEFELPKEMGLRYAPVSAENDLVSKTAYLDYEVLDAPKIKISEVEHPEDVRYNDDFNISFLLRKNSSSTPFDVLIKVTQDKRIEEISLSKLERNRIVFVEFAASKLKEGENEFDVFIIYKDKNSVKYSEELKFYVGLVDVTFWQKIKIWVNRLFG